MGEWLAKALASLEAVPTDQGFGVPLVPIESPTRPSGTIGTGFTGSGFDLGRDTEDSASPGPSTPIGAPNTEADFEERAAIIEDGSGVPREWAEGFARLDLSNRPRGFTVERWRQLIDDGGRFLDRLGSKALSLGWKAEDVFGVHPTAPSARYDLMGLVPLISGGVVVSVSDDRAAIRHSSGSEVVYLRRPIAGAIALWELIE